MLETATTKQKEAMEKLDKIQEQRKSFRATSHKLLDEICHQSKLFQRKEQVKQKKE